ncbi:MAG: hypothetical protein CM15mP83_2960 [Flavobacteriaceae bacterium]|nr:MAG: hypothetical protein CM15mP83_2960 [Flavobacteriaceae bacterium]
MGSKESNHIAFDCQPQPNFNQNFEQVIKHLTIMNHRGFAIIFCSSQQQADRFVRIAEELSSKNCLKSISCPLSGFIDNQNHVACYTDHQFLNVITNSDSKMAMQKQAISLKEFNQLSVGIMLLISIMGLVNLVGSSASKLMASYKRRLNSPTANVISFM